MVRKLALAALLVVALPLAAQEKFSLFDRVRPVGTGKAATLGAIYYTCATSPPTICQLNPGADGTTIVYASGLPTVGAGGAGVWSDDLTTITLQNPSRRVLIGTLPSSAAKFTINNDAPSRAGLSVWGASGQSVPIFATFLSPGTGAFSVSSVGVAVANLGLSVNGLAGFNGGTGFGAMSVAPTDTGMTAPTASFAAAGSGSTGDIIQWQDNSLVRFGGVTVLGNVNLGALAGLTEVTNDSGTGTTANRLAKLTGAPSTAVVAGTSDTSGFVGICVEGCGTSGAAAIATAGQASCAFDGAVTAGHYVQASSTTGGQCHDAGASFPSSGQVIGRVLVTNGSAGTRAVALFSPGVTGFAVGSGTVTSVAMTVPTELSISGSPVTTSGTLGITWNSASGNKVIASPSNGSSGAYAGRALVAADLPNTAVTPGSYTSTNLTVDAQGRITAASNGSGGGVTVSGSPAANYLSTFTSGSDITGTNEYLIDSSGSGRYIVIDDKANVYNPALILRRNGVDKVYVSHYDDGSTVETDITATAGPLFLVTSTGKIVMIAANGNVYMGSTLPSAGSAPGYKLTLSPGDIVGWGTNTGSTYGGITGNASTVGLTITQFEVSGVASTAGTCGSGAAVASGSNAQAGRITAGTGVTTCAVNLGYTFTHAPTCFGVNETTGAYLPPTVTTSTVTFGGTISVSDVIAWGCQGYK